jgi:pimeloyl-ACP methyl ester carboxylesterase
LPAEHERGRIRILHGRNLVPRSVHGVVALLLPSGELDPVTTPFWADEAATQLPNSLHVVLPEAGHFLEPQDCVQGIMARFFEAGTVEGLDASCAERARRRQFE